MGVIIIIIIIIIFIMQFNSVSVYYEHNIRTVLNNYCQHFMNMQLNVATGISLYYTFNTYCINIIL